MERWLIFIGLTGALLQVSFAKPYYYYFVNTSLTWTDAQAVCRRNYTDLATIENEADDEDVKMSSLNYTGKAWIGLYDEFVDSWKWSLNDSSFYGPGELTFRDWDTGQPSNHEGDEKCIGLYELTGKWHDYTCSDLFHFVCYNGTVNDTSSFVLVREPKSWTDAQTYCRENYIDLASVRNMTENEKIQSLPRSKNVWIGLYGEKSWSDGNPSLFRNWATGQPNGFASNPLLSVGATCTAAAFGNQEGWFDEDCTLTIPFICYRRGPENANGFRQIAGDETSITLQWDKINNNTNFVLLFNGTETFISAPDGDGPLTHTVSSLTAGTKYTFTLFSEFENLRSNGVKTSAITAPANANGLRQSAENETSITLQWDKINNDTNFVLLFNGTETFISAPDGDGPLTHIVSSLTAGTKYTFTLFSVFENLRSNGVQISAVTAPANANGLRQSAENETSITLQWDKINNSTNFVLLFNGTETFISAPDGDGPLTHTVSSLTAGTKYTFTLFSVFENIRSREVSITATTGKMRFLTSVDVCAESSTSKYYGLNG
uniref:Uncharacterized LOC107099021 n=1 Tax=Cyprinodon variegatus TaxID=28743 RepID=A0A3Q2DXN5_CYPVA